MTRATMNNVLRQRSFIQQNNLHEIVHFVVREMFLVDEIGIGT
jgi:hypothetical protein